MTKADTGAAPTLIETPRLTMRQFVMEDAEAVYRFSSHQIGRAHV